MTVNLETWLEMSFDQSILSQKARFISGDWEALAAQCSGSESDRYDVILMADTIYNPGV